MLITREFGDKPSIELDPLSALFYNHKEQPYRLSFFQKGDAMCS